MEEKKAVGFFPEQKYEILQDIRTFVQDHVETLFAQVKQETGAGLPQFVKVEFEAFLECGMLAHGFLRLRYGKCAQDPLVAFSWKGRGFCPPVASDEWRRLRPYSSSTSFHK